MTKKNRVVITGMGTINPLGDNLEKYYNNLIKGKSGIKKWESIDVSYVSCKIGGDLGDYDFRKALDNFKNDLTDEKFKAVRKHLKKMTLSNKSGVITALTAFKDAGLLNYNFDPYRVSAMVAGHNFNTGYVFEQIHQFDEEPEWIDPLFGVESLDPNIPGTLSEVLGIKGAAFNLGAACASGNVALRDGFRDILTGEYDISVVCGPFWGLNEFDIHSMGFLDALSTKEEYQNKPEIASRPFDVDRDGFIPSHGAATLVIENLEHAKARGAKIYAEILNVAANSNSDHLPAPNEEAQGRLMKAVIENAGLKVEDIDFVSAHATSTPLGDTKEIEAIKRAFGKHAYNLKINAPKSMLGHTTWSAALVELTAAILQMQNGKIHGTINIDNLDPAVDLDVCKDGPQDHQIKVMIKNSFGFGGLNCCSLIKRYEE